MLAKLPIPSFLKSPLAIAVMIALLSVPYGLAQFFDHIYWNVRFKATSYVSPAAQTISLVSLDDGHAGLAEVSNSTARQAALLRLLVAQEPRRIFMDLPVSGGVDPAGDKALYDAISAAGSRVVMVNRGKDRRPETPTKLIDKRFVPPPETQVTVSVWDVDVIGYALSAPAAVAYRGRTFASVSALMADGMGDRRLIPNFDIRPDGFPVLSAAGLLRDGGNVAAIRGKTLFITATDPEADTSLGYLGHSRVPSAILDISTAENPLNGRYRMWGNLPLLIAVGALFFLAATRRRRREKALVAVAIVMLFILPSALRQFGLIVGTGGAMVVTLVYTPLRLLEMWRTRVRQTSSASGLPNISALAEREIPTEDVIVAAGVSQYEQILASLPRELHGECARQIARRIAIVADGCEVFDSGSGQFVWVENSQQDARITDHLEGLKALFSAPLAVGSHVLDTNVNFGIDRTRSASSTVRIQSALASVLEAQEKGQLFAEFGEDRLAQSTWDLSLHARIDDGLRNGDIWLALQPQLDLHSNQIVGAEALIRWQDPVRGMIPPDTFIVQAERAGRIEVLTYWVFERAIEIGQRLANAGHTLQLSVNLSARMVEHPALIRRLADIVRDRRADCRSITIEVTETFSLSNHDQAKRNLVALRAMGFKVSIDDFGTGQATLAYLAEIPCDEIKLDRRFIAAIHRPSRERTIVGNVIKMAHDLDQIVVAEGIEDADTLEILRDMNCDIAQGYHIAKPMKFDDFAEMLNKNVSQAARHSA